MLLSHFNGEQRLQVHLTPYDQSRLVDIWVDTKIKPGAKWHDEIMKAIELAKVTVLSILGKKLNNHTHGIIEAVVIPASFVASHYPHRVFTVVPRAAK